MDNMKSDKAWVVVGVMAMGLIFGRPPVRAQPPGGPSSNGAQPSSVDEDLGAPEGDPNSLDDESIVIDDEKDLWSRGVSTEDRRAARELLKEGNHLYDVPLYAKAAEQYAAALRKWKHPAIYFNLAQAQLQLGNEVEARASLEHALEHGERPLRAKRFQKAQRQLEEVTRQLGRIRVSCQTPGAEVTLDGVTLFIGPGIYQGWIKAKDHELTAKGRGYLPVARRVTISSEDLKEIEVGLVTLREVTDAARRWATWKPRAVMAAGGAIATSGVVLHMLAARNFNAYDRGFLDLSCVKHPDPKFPGCLDVDIGSDLDSQLNRAKRQQAIAVGAYVGGGSLIAAGIVLLYLNRPRLVEGGIGLPARNVAIVPSVSSDMLGILIRIEH